MKGIPITLEIAAVTDIGQSRSSNQDNFFVNGTFVDHYRVKTERFDCVDNEEVHVLAVCDGMGGLKDGDVAAMTGVTTLSDFSEELQSIRTYEDASYTARSLIRKANDRILRKSKKTGKKMRMMPVFANREKRTFTFGEEIVYEPENGYAAEQERILEEAYLQLTELSER